MAGLGQGASVFSEIAGRAAGRAAGWAGGSESDWQILISGLPGRPAQSLSTQSAASAMLANSLMGQKGFVIHSAHPVFQSKYSVDIGVRAGGHGLREANVL